MSTWRSLLRVRRGVARRTIVAAAATVATVLLLAALLMPAGGGERVNLAVTRYRLGVGRQGKYVELTFTSDKPVTLVSWRLGGSKGRFEVYVPGRGEANVTIPAPWWSGHTVLLSVEDGGGNEYDFQLNAPRLPSCEVTPLGPGVAGGAVFYSFKVLYDNKSGEKRRLRVSVVAVPRGLPRRVLIVSTTSRGEVSKLFNLLRGAGVSVNVVDPEDVRDVEDYGLVVVVGGVWRDEGLPALRRYLINGGRVLWAGPPPGLYVEHGGVVIRSPVASPDISLFGRHVVDEFNATGTVEFPESVFAGPGPSHIVGVMASADTVVARHGSYIVAGTIRMERGVLLYIGLGEVKAETLISLIPYLFAGAGKPSITVYTATVGPHDGRYLIVYASQSNLGGAVALADCGGIIRSAYISGAG